VVAGHREPPEGQGIEQPFDDFPGAVDHAVLGDVAGQHRERGRRNMLFPTGDGLRDRTCRVIQSMVACPRSESRGG
jgi:hypothetical protein